MNLDVEIWRGNEKGAYCAYRVPKRENQTVLDVVTWVQRNLEPALAYRFACRVGVCGSCAMTVNGRPRWTCRTRIAAVARDNRLRLGPLRNLPVVRDLVTDMTGFFDKWQRAEGRFRGSDAVQEERLAVLPESPERAAANAAIECINCGVCYAACDVVRGKPAYLGPAALNRAWAGYNDIRDRARDRFLAAVSKRGGCHSCHSQQSCTEHCPVGLNPTASIAGLKRASVTGLLRDRGG